MQPFKSLFTTGLLLMVMLSIATFSVMAQGTECFETESKYVYVADVLTKTDGVAGVRHSKLVVPGLEDQGTCRFIEELEEARTSIPGDELKRIKTQSIETVGECYPMKVCPDNQSPGNSATMLKKIMSTK